MFSERIADRDTRDLAAKIKVRENQTGDGETERHVLMDKRRGVAGTQIRMVESARCLKQVWCKAMSKLSFLFLVLALAAGQSSRAPILTGPDERYKADMLVVVAHPDDESGDIAGYLARAIYDQHRRVAVIFTSRGEDGDNEAGPEEGNSLGAEREIEGRRAVASFGVTNVWFLGTPNVSSQNVITALERWGHGSVLEQVVRLVRLTRPEVILTWLPAYVAGENHADHQASSVIANEAFDLAGDPTVFSEQLVPDRSGGQSAEGLLPWQPKKIYYFSDASDYPDYGERPPLPSPYRKPFLTGKGPTYSNTDVSPTQHVPYSRLAAQETAFHLTQEGKVGVDALEKNDFKEFERPARLIFGKSLVGGTMTDDVFEGIVPGAVPSARIVARKREKLAAVSLELGGPWNFYGEFWKGHNIEHLAELLPVPEMAIEPGTNYVHVPLLIRNDTATIQEVTITAKLPEGWSDNKTRSSVYQVRPGEVYPVGDRLHLPEIWKPEWQEISWTALFGGQQSGAVILRVYAGANGAMPQ